jgi:ankyrin repeat protein
MLSLRNHNFQILILFILLSIPLCIRAQEEAEIDTSGYLAFGFGSATKDVLNFNLMVAASKGYVAEIHRIIKNGADPDTKTFQNVTPLMYAVANNRLDAVAALLTYHPDVNVLTTFSETPLLAAVKNGNVEIAEALIRDSADINSSDRYGATPLHYASIYGYFYVVDLLLYYEADIFKKTNDGTSPLMAAVWAGYSDIADLLLQHNSNPEEADNNGFTPFLIAAQNGDTLTMEMLIKRNINLYEINKYGYNALDICIKSNKKEATAYLLRKGDKWTSNGNKSISPYLVASKYSRKDITGLLEKNNIPKTYKFGFDQMSVSGSFKGCLYDYFIGFGISFKEPSLNGGIFAGIDTKPGYTRVLMKKSETLFYQYKDRSSMVYAGLFKDFSITDRPAKGNWSFSASVAAGYTFGNKLKGTLITPENRIRFNPEISLRWTKNNLNMYCGIEYLKSEFYKIGPVWLRLGVSYNIFFDKVRAPGKDIKWF